jgi:lipopolysaccharide/colanic/teichoic acid biosynthesis glycosyltransferase
MFFFQNWIETSSPCAKAMSNRTGSSVKCDALQSLVSPEEKSLRFTANSDKDSFMSTLRPGFHEMTTTSLVQARTSNGAYARIKPWLDFALALTMLPLAAPFILLALLIVRLSSPGPWIYVQRRLGQGGKVFTIYKIRTMYQDSERLSGPQWCLPGDPRVTPVGRFLRWSHIDELPQLINVLLGQMSLVGPRPERPEFVEQLERVVPNYRQRLVVRPGVTGLAQVLHPSDTDLSSVRRKLDYDLCYLESMNPWLDLRVIVGTLFLCAGIPAPNIGRILQLPQPDDCSFRRESLGVEPELTPTALISDRCLS